MLALRKKTYSIHGVLGFVLAFHQVEVSQCHFLSSVLSCLNVEVGYVMN